METHRPTHVGGHLVEIAAIALRGGVDGGDTSGIGEQAHSHAPGLERDR